jgi:chromate transport protein ChrA
LLVAIAFDCMLKGCSLPGALGMYGLSLGISNIGSTLPRQAYAVLSGLNAATVGIIALAAVELSEKAITDKVTRTLLFLGAAAGLLYNALWYFPLLMFVAGCVTVIHDYRWLHAPVKTFTGMFKRNTERTATEEEQVDLPEMRKESGGRVRRPPGDSHPEGSQQAEARAADGIAHEENEGRTDTSAPAEEPRVVPHEHRLNFSWKVGALVIASFLGSFVVIMVLRGVLRSPPLLYRLFANMYLAGTIIFGGGPVVIPLLREYVVAEGWVSPRDFLIGLAIIQAFPGPNFNLAVFLGALTAINGGFHSAAGAALGYVGIFAPGLVLVHGTMGLWSTLRSRRWVKSGLRGINAGAVGLIYTAVYRLWQIGFIDEGFQSGKGLGDDPWWVVVTATSFVGGRWYGLNPPSAIILGAVLGLIRYAVVSRSGS